MKAVDLFAGAGGTTTGAKLAGVNVLCAVNHWPVAVATHAAAHPEAQHMCEDAAGLDPTTLPDHDLLLASPSCTGHTRARGKEQPHHDAARATAWCVVRVLEAKRPPLVIVENVPEMLDWVLYRAWRLALSSLGYRVSEQVLDAADCGVPQNRERLFVVGSRVTKKPILVPAPKRRHVAAREVLDLDGGEWGPVSRWCAKTRARIAAGQQAHGPDVLVPYYGNTKGCRSLDRPIGTLTTKARYALVRGDRGRMLTVPEMLRLSSFPEGYPLRGTVADQTKLIGNAVPPALAQYVIESVMRGAR